MKHLYNVYLKSQNINANIKNENNTYINAALCITYQRLYQPETAEHWS